MIPIYKARIECEQLNSSKNTQQLHNNGEHAGKSQQKQLITYFLNTERQFPCPAFFLGLDPNN